jgi:hypothetical protein
MIMLKGIIQNGQVRLTPPADLPDGTPVTVLSPAPSDALGMPDDQWPTDSNGIAQMVARMERVEPFELTPAEVDAMEAWRLRVKQYTIAGQKAAIDGLFP